MVGGMAKSCDSHVPCSPLFPSDLNDSITSFFESRATKFTKEGWLTKYTTKPAEPAWNEKLPGSRSSIDAGIHHDVRVSPCWWVIIIITLNHISISQNKDTAARPRRQESQSANHRPTTIGITNLTAILRTMKIVSANKIFVRES